MNDSLSLFSGSSTPETIPMQDAQVRFMQAFYRQPLSGELMERLLSEICWRQETIILWGKEHLQPRLSAWYGDAGSRYTYSGVMLDPHPWSDTLLRIRRDIENATGHHFNSVLLNLYRNEHDSVGWHSDAEPELSNAPAIASLSLGDTRMFRLRHRKRKEVQQVSIALTDGSLLLMEGTTQRFWQHAVMKEKDARLPRINLTFRTIQHQK
ncbi:MAG TPA: alpha-ketoglutarate-dependent dioxygenase AlkB [Noviherbaspirillum sp.]|uniref:alpha-ketoglutarate-dependent dioxygenase AlkB family protein n=1 Tax=Noviherbaspirillum sp. TaxID=1926288 RepID=UPI002B45B599|nr:alpha-ketoglutarate-dependent dioxygenase AlkB [Noviherbaspirillum sp.]HJV86175.1 alpha-ketoglutarate-dependent dioxygenase AlkB [Noviherbaspirillum sp.]